MNAAGIELDELATARHSALEADPAHQTVTYDDFYAYMPTHQYIFTPTRELWPSSSVNARLPKVHEGAVVLSPATWLDQNRPVDQMTWAPGEPLVIWDRLVADGGWIKRKGSACFNLYRPPAIVGGDRNGVAPWCDHIRSVYPSHAGHIVRWLADRKSVV